MAAVDYARLRQTLSRGRLLFIAHRKEILDQSRATFQYALRDASFGELWVDGARPERYEHVFASVQSLSRLDLSLLDPKHFDVVIIDEFHHTAAPTYGVLMAHLQPKEFLGLTATPERAEGQSVTHWFDGRIAA
jgi:superfamily II DNA or RNA helicase